MSLVKILILLSAVSFLSACKLNVYVEGEGTVTASPVTGVCQSDAAHCYEFDRGNQLSVTAIPLAGHKVVHWSRSDCGSSLVCVIPSGDASNDVDLTVTFEIDTDRDGDGHLNENDAFPDDPSEWSDLDDDGTGDNADLDRDGDGISNAYEIQLGFDPNDKTNTPADLDGDAIPDVIDTDIDGDGHLNNADVFPRDKNEWADLDTDGIGDNADLDRDGDGISNAFEIQLGFNPNDATNTPDDLDRDGTPDVLDYDIDGDGYLNGSDAFPRDATEWADLDADGTGDNADLDRDGDGISNAHEIELGFDPNDKANTPADLDSDTIPDAIDTDIDGDGHLNEVDVFPRDKNEWADLDADGTGDNADLDRDGDGISNVHEVELGFDPNDKSNTPADLDGDAIPDAIDTDIDGDGHLNDADVFPRDKDEWADLDDDGTGDNADLDRDGDGISNAHEIELGFDPNDKTNTPADLDGDATPDALDSDIDGDGHLNETDVFPRDATEWADLDADGTGDNADLDRDGDGISNVYEVQLGFDPNDKANTPADLDRDAIPDAIDTDIDGDGHLNEVDVFPRDAAEWADLDADGTGDNTDLDRDGDGISNVYEVQLGFDPNDKTNTPADLDADAIPDAIDTDIDGDGHLNDADVFPHDATEWADLDADGTGDNADLDRDGDGISNAHEIELGFDPNDKANTPADLDGDALPDANDTDIDGDGHLNDDDVFPRDKNEWADLDADGTGDNADLDRDGDGISNVYEVQLGFDPNDKTNTPADLDSDAIPDAIDTDIDGDGHLNDADTFPRDKNEWADLDADGMGDNADLDRDGDGISNVHEVQLGFDPNDKTKTPADLDGDALPDAIDTDIDDDGHLNEVDVFPRDETEWADLDADGTGDNADLDRDGDGFNNDVEVTAGTDPDDRLSYPDVVAPVITLNATPGEVQLSHVNISGQVTDDNNDIQKVWINHAALQNAEFVITLDQTGNFNEVMPLEIGVNPFRVNAIDGSGNTSHSDINVTFKSPPVVKNLSPVNGGVVLVEKNVITGQVETEYDLNDLKLFLDGTLLITTEESDNVYQFDTPALAFSVGDNQFELLIQTPHGTHKTSLNYQYIPEGASDLPLPEIQLLFPAEAATLAGSNTAYSLIVTSHAGLITPSVNGQVIANTNNQSIMQIKGILALNQQAGKSLLNVEAKDALGRKTKKVFEFSTDNIAPVITWGAPLVNKQTLFVVASENRITGKVSDANLASLLINNKSVQMQSTSTPGSYNFYLDAQVPTATSKTFIAEARDISGNFSNGWITITNNTQLELSWITPNNQTQYYTEGDVDIAMSSLNDASSSTIRIQLFNANDSSNALTSTSLQKSGNWYVGQFKAPSIAGEYFIKVEVFSLSDEVLFTSQRSIQVKDLNSQVFSVIDTLPQALDANISVDQPIKISFNKPITNRNITFEVLQTVHGKSYEDEDLPNTPFFKSKGDVLVQVDKQREQVAINTSLLMGDQTLVLYPKDQLEFGAIIEVEVSEGVDVLKRFRYKTRPVPTLVRGRIKDSYGQSVAGLEIEIMGTDIKVKTDAEGGFGFGYDESTLIASGDHILHINPKMKNTELSNRFWEVYVRQGRINELGDINVSNIDSTQPISISSSTGKLNLSKGEVQIQYAGSLIFPEGYVEGMKTNFLSSSQINEPFINYKPSFMYQTVPFGIEITEVDSIKIKVPTYLSSREYISTAYDNEHVLIIGRNNKRKLLEVVGIGILKNNQVSSVGRVWLDNIDYIGYEFSAERHRNYLESYAQGNINIERLRQAVEGL